MTTSHKFPMLHWIPLDENEIEGTIFATFKNSKLVEVSDCFLNSFFTINFLCLLFVSFFLTTSSENYIEKSEYIHPLDNFLELIWCVVRCIDKALGLLAWCCYNLYNQYPFHFYHFWIICSTRYWQWDMSILHFVAIYYLHDDLFISITCGNS